MLSVNLVDDNAMSQWQNVESFFIEQGQRSLSRSTTRVVDQKDMSEIHVTGLRDHKWKCGSPCPSTGAETADFRTVERSSQMEGGERYHSCKLQEGP